MVGWAEIDLDHGELVEIDFQAWVLALAQDPAICTTHGIGIENLCHATVPTLGLHRARCFHPGQFATLLTCCVGVDSKT